MAVNTFSPLLNGVSLPGPLQVDGDIAFEQQRSAWAGGYWPTLDLIVEAEQCPVRLFVESKCTEFLRQGHPDFSQAFVKHAKRRSNVATATTFEPLAEDAALFDPLDARQLAKHFLTAKRTVVDATEPFAVILLYIWWEPDDATEQAVFERHREAVEAFAAAVPDTDVSLRGISYRNLWQHWEALHPRRFLSRLNRRRARERFGDQWVAAHALGSARALQAHRRKSRPPRAAPATRSCLTFGATSLSIRLEWARRGRRTADYRRRDGVPTSRFRSHQGGPSGQGCGRRRVGEAGVSK